MPRAMGIYPHVDKFDFKQLVDNREKYIDFFTHSISKKGLDSNRVEVITVMHSLWITIL